MLFSAAPFRLEPDPKGDRIVDAAGETIARLRPGLPDTIVRLFVAAPLLLRALDAHVTIERLGPTRRAAHDLNDRWGTDEWTERSSEIVKKASREAVLAMDRVMESGP